MSEPALGLRRAGRGDGPFLERMVRLAAGWRDGVEAELTPETARYVEGFGWREGDAGLVAVRDGAAIGAAWWRRFAASEPGYGFVAEDVPELSLAVVAAARGAGAGRALLDGLLGLAAEEGVPALSLSVEVDNPARRLYERAGFVVVAEGGGALTMLRRV